MGGSGGSSIELTISGLDAVVEVFPTLREYGDSVLADGNTFRAIVSDGHGRSWRIKYAGPAAGLFSRHPGLGMHFTRRILPFLAGLYADGIVGKFGYSLFHDDEDFMEYVRNMGTVEGEWRYSTRDGDTVDIYRIVLGSGSARRTGRLFARSGNRAYAIIPSSEEGTVYAAVMHVRGRKKTGDMLAVLNDAIGRVMD